MEVDLRSLFGLHVTWYAQLYSLAETTPQPLPPALGWDSMVSKDRRHLFVTAWGILSIIWSQDEGAEHIPDQDVSWEAYLCIWRLSTSKQVDRKDISSLVVSRDRVTIYVADPSIFFSDPVRRTVILTYGTKSGSRRPMAISCSNNDPIKKFCLQNLNF
jgi:hypothetical protein